MSKASVSMLLVFALTIGYGLSMLKRRLGPF